MKNLSVSRFALDSGDDIVVVVASNLGTIIGNRGQDETNARYRAYGFESRIDHE